MKRKTSSHDDEDDYQPPAKKTTKKKTTKKTHRSSGNLRVTRLMKLDAARRAVFETVELLENILEQLPPRDIVVGERVCKQFQQVIASSQKLQRALFKTVDNNGEEWVVSKTAKRDLGSRSRFTYEFSSAVGLPSHAEDRSEPLTVCQLNTAIFAPPKAESKLDRSNYAQDVFSCSGTTVQTHSELEHILMDMVKGKSSSWTDMHITSPPCQNVHVLLRLRLSKTKVCRIDTNIVSQYGITFGELTRQLSLSTGSGKIGPGDSRVLYRSENGVHKGYEHCGGVPLKEFIASWESKHGSVVEVDHTDTYIKLQGIVLPTDEESEVVRGRQSEVKW